MIDLFGLVATGHHIDLQDRARFADEADRHRNGSIVERGRLPGRAAGQNRKLILGRIAERFAGKFEFEWAETHS